MELAREQLYDLVWSEPIQTVSAKMGVSNVGLAKACKTARVPVPWKGYWNKLHAGKQVSSTPLPRRELCQRGTISLKGPLTEELAARLKGEVGDPGPFEDIEAMRERFVGRLGRVTVPRSSIKLHRSVRRLFDLEEARARDWPQYFEPRFTSPYEKRRLRLLNGLYLALVRTGGGGIIQGEHAEKTIARVGDIDVPITVGRLGDEHSDRICITIEYAPTGHPWERWQDDQAPMTLENRLTEVAIAIAHFGELAHRDRVLADLEYARGAPERARRRQLERENKERQREADRRAAVEKQMLAELLEKSNQFHDASKIRAYVEAVLAAAGGSPSAELANWAAWALEQADERDPTRLPPCRAETKGAFAS